MSFSAVLDACVLVPYHLCDLLLRLAEAGMFTPLWSEEILGEVERTLVGKLGISASAAERRLNHIRAAFPGSLVEGYGDLVPRMRCHKKDRHVLATAVRAGSQVLVTANVKDFPLAATASYDVEVVTPEGFLFDQLELDPETVMNQLERQASAYRKPTMDKIELLRRLRAAVPNFAQLVGSSLMAGDIISGEEAILVQSTDEELRDAFLGVDEPDLGSPAWVGRTWYSALLNLPESMLALESLSLRPSDWHGYSSTVTMLEGFGLASGVFPAIEAPDRVAYMRFITDVGSSAQVVRAGWVRGRMQVLTLVCVDDQWRVFSVGGSDFPTWREIRS